MVYVALLRGINVGGNNKINMKELKVAFEQLGLQNVITYINSGNIIFKDCSYSEADLSALIEDKITSAFQLQIKVLIRSIENYEKIMQALPSTWTNDSSVKSDVLFLWEEIDSDSILDIFVPIKNIDTVLYVEGTLLWSVPKESISKSSLLKIVGTPFYKKMTIRNVNSTRKIYELMKSIDTK